MQKVVGSNPISRFPRSSCIRAESGRAPVEQVAAAVAQ